MAGQGARPASRTPATPRPPARRPAAVVADAAHSRAPPAPHRQIRELGHGAYGTAVLMRQRQTSELVAVKFIERGTSVSGGGGVVPCRAGQPGPAAIGPGPPLHAGAAAVGSTSMHSSRGASRGGPAGPALPT